MPDMAEMCTDLMCSSGLKGAFHKRNVAEPLKHLIMRYGTTSFLLFFIDLHNEPILYITADKSCDRTFILLKIAPHQRGIFPVNRVVEELLSQFHLHQFVLGNKKDATGVFRSEEHTSELQSL